MADGQFLQRARSFITEPVFANMAGRTPEDVERRRLWAENLLASSLGDDQVTSWTEGLGNLVNAFVGSRTIRGVERENAAAAERNRALWEQLAGLAAPGSGGAASTSYDISPPSPPPAPPSTQPTNNGSWMLAGSGATGTNTPPQIVYANEGAIRNDPLAGQLTNVLQAAASEAGIDQIRVVSGGQEAAGEGGGRTGSTRHDHGNAADVELYVGGRLLDFTNPADQAIYQQFVTAAARRGITGIGAGTDYMGNTRIHVGYGDPAVWGAGGSSANAPEWLRTAYGAAGGQQPRGQAPAGGVNPEVIRLLLGGDAQAQALAQQMIIQQLTAQPTQPDYGWQEVDGTLLRTDPQGNAVPVYTTPASGTERRTAEDTNGVLRYIDTGEPVFPNVQQAPAAPDFGNENALRTQFNQITAPFRDTAQAYHRIETALANPSAASDVSLIFAYMRMLDPASTVREGEFATAQQTTGLPGQIVNLYNRLLTGERLNDAQRADFGLQAQGLYEASVRQYNQYADFYRSIAPQYGIDPSRVVLPLEAAPTASGPARSFVVPANPNDPLGLFP